MPPPLRALSAESRWTPLWRFRWNWGVCALLFVALAQPSLAVEERAQRAKSTASAAEIRANRLDIAWENLPALQAVQNLAKAEGIHILLDRRIDPDRRVDLSVRNEPVELILKRTAQQLDAEVSWIDRLAYLGPASAALKLRTLIELRRGDANEMAPAEKRRLNSTNLQQWNDAAIPSELVRDATGSLVVNLELIPHDLWRAGSLPKVRLCDQLSLWLAQFDLTYERVDREHVRLAPIPDEVAISRTYSAGAQPSARIAAFRAVAPGAKIDRAADQIHVSALIEEHEQFQALLKGQKVKKTNVAAGKQVYTLKFQNVPLSRVVEQLSKSLDRPIEISDSAKEHLRGGLDQPVTVDVKQATLTELMTAVLTSSGLTFTEMGDRIVIEPAPVKPRR